MNVALRFEIVDRIECERPNWDDEKNRAKQSGTGGARKKIDEKWYSREMSDEHVRFLFLQNP